MIDEIIPVSHMIRSKQHEMWFPDINNKSCKKKKILDCSKPWHSSSSSKLFSCPQAEMCKFGFASIALPMPPLPKQELEPGLGGLMASEGSFQQLPTVWSTKKESTSLASSWCIMYTHTPVLFPAYLLLTQHGSLDHLGDV